MATTGIVKGRNVALQWGGTAIEDVTENGFSGSVNEVELTSYDSSGFREVDPGTISGTFSVSYFCAYDATEGFDEMLADWLAGTKQTALLGTTSTGDTTISGTAWVKDLSWSGSLDNPGQVTATLQLTGTITQGTV